MAKYDVTYKCGHEGQVQLFGPYKERDRKLAYLATILCPQCQRNELAKVAETITKEFSLPDLAGSEKQVEWATSIRAKAFMCLEGIKHITTTDKAKSTVEKWDVDLRAKTEAIWWIDNRNEMPDRNKHQDAYFEKYVINLFHSLLD